MNKYYATIGFPIILFFTSISLFAQRNCGSFLFHKEQLEHNLEYAKARKTIETQTKAFISENNTARMTVTIPVVVHIVWRTNFPVENISEAQVLSQIDALNKDFNLQNSNAVNIPAALKSVAANCNINFCLAKRTPENNVTTGINRLQSNRTVGWGTADDVKLPYKGGFATWNPDKYLNIYVCSIGGGILGYAPYPGAPAQNDGIVIDYRYFGTTGIVSSPYHLGRTATHEVGHWLNLDHIWGDSICGDDEVADTPVHSDANTGCPAYPKYNTCSSASEMPMNYMDYTDDACMNMFTIGQNARMQAVFAPNGFRNSLLYSDACQPLTQTVSCGTPIGLQLNTITPTTASVSWVAVSGANSYDISYKTASATTWTKTSSVSNTLLISGLQSATAYQFQVQAKCDGVSGLSSTLSTFTTLVLPCPTPSNLIFSSITSNSATVSWSQASTMTLTALKYRKQGTTTWTSILPNSAGQNIQNLLPSTVYEVQILSACGTVTAVPLTGTFTTAAVVQNCGTPTSVAVNTIATTTANIVWTTVSGATSYRIFYRAKNANIWSSNDSATNSFLLSGLLSGVNYEVKIAALCNGGIGTDSQLLEFVTKTIACGNIPTNVGISAITANAAAVNWTATAGAVSYKLQYRKSNATTWTIIGTVFGTTYNMINLTALTPYDVQVAAVCGINSTSNFSTQKSFSTLSNVASCSDKYENNNTLLTAKVILPNSTISANIGSIADNDWFKFANTTAQRYIRLTLSNIPAEYQIRLYDSNAVLISEGTSSSISAKSLKWNNGKVGSFFIQIFSKNGVFSTQNCYELKIETSSNVYKSNNKQSADNQDITNGFDVNIAPNPVQEYAKISISTDKNISLNYTMFDLTGKTIQADKFDIAQDNNSFFLETTHLQNGIYFLRFSHEDKVVTKKIVVQK